MRMNTYGFMILNALFIFLLISFFISSHLHASSDCLNNQFPLYVKEKKIFGPSYHYMDTLPPSHMKVTDLHLNENGDAAWTRQISKDGQVIQTAVYYYSNGLVTLVASEKGPDTDVMVSDINDAGQILMVKNMPQSVETYKWENGSLEQLTSPSDKGFRGYSINNSGDVSGVTYRRYPNGLAADPVIISEHETTVLKKMSPKYSEYPFFLNENDQTTGAVFVNNAYRMGILWSDGDIRNVGFIGGSGQTYVTGLNRMGKVIGYSINKHHGFSAFIHEKNLTYELSSPNGDDSFAYDINENSQIVGEMGYLFGKTTAFLIENHQYQRLPEPDHVINSCALDINDHGDITGLFRVRKDQHHIALWVDKKIIPIGKMDGMKSCKGVMINNKGQVLGSCMDKKGNRIAFLYENGMFNHLSEQVPSAY